MEIKSTNIRVQASKNYQVFEISFEATCESSNEIESLKSAAIKYAIKGINELCGEKETPEVKATVVSQPIVQQPVEPVIKEGTKKQINGVWYEFKDNKVRNSKYFQICDDRYIDENHKKYINCDNKE